MSRIALGVLAALAALLLAAPAQATPTSLPDPADALAAAEDVFDGDARHPTRDATMVLRDLALVADRLPPAAKRRAEALLDRPDDPGGSRGGEVRFRVPGVYVCTAHFCVHYVPTTSDAPRSRDDNANGIPNDVESTASVLEFIWNTEVNEYGFRPPKSDLLPEPFTLDNYGPDGRFDVYLADIVDQGILGFCSAEQPDNYQFWDVPGFCVLDNDYSPAQIGAPGLGGQTELELTAVHEFFHAIQFGYDFADDIWFLEGTATWIEDEVYSDVNEPYRRFGHSPLVQPHVPVDTASATEPFQYGAWVFWRFLEELLAPPRTHIDPGVIRRVWEFADGRPGAQDLYSLQAVDATLRERGIRFQAAFNAFAVANFVPGKFYREGRIWPSPKPHKRVVSALRRSLPRESFRLDHLSSRYVELVPGRGVGRKARLSIAVDLPATLTGASASAIVFGRSGARPARAISLSAGGDGRIVVPFGRGSVRRVVLVLANGTTRFSCGSFTFFSCRGRSLDDKRAYSFTARLLG
jgi:hypothetical protein